MSVLIKGMDMPKNDSWVNVRIKEKGGKPIIAFITGEDLEGKYFEIEEIPTPHGRLIDADRLMEVIEKNSYLLKGYYNSLENGMFLTGIKQAIDEAPTIIEAEVE